MSDPIYLGSVNWDHEPELAGLDEIEAKANKSVTTKQREITYGSYWVRATPTGVLEFGQVITQQSAEAMQTAETVRALRDMYRRGYRYSMYHSKSNPQGDYGDVHISSAWPITKEEFENALKASFVLTDSDWELEMLTRITREMKEAMTSPKPSPPQSQHNLNTLRLVKLQVATKTHECDECVDPIEEGERYMRVALPPTVEAFPDASDVAQEDAWRYVDRTWIVEKTHELCYAKRYFRPGGAFLVHDNDVH